MRCSKSCYLCDLELVDLFENTVIEQVYYISGKELTASDLLHHARMEWGVETMHWLLDVRYREDYFRAQNKTIQKNMNMSRKLALNLAGIYKNKHSKKTPMSHIMFDCLMNPQHLLTVLGKN